MEHQEIVEELASATNYTKREARRILRNLVLIIRDALAAGRDVRLEGLGRLLNTPVSPRQVRNPHTGERFVSDPSRRVRFVPSTKLRNSVKASIRFFDRPSEETFGLED